MEQMQLLMALSLYINSIRLNPLAPLVPATPEQLFGAEISREQDLEPENDYEYDFEEDIEEDRVDIEVPSAKENAPSAWNMENRIMDVDDSEESLEKRSPGEALIEPV